MNESYSPIQPGTSVTTTKSDSVRREDWTDEGWASKKWGLKGVVIAHHNSHGLCYEVRHEDGTVGTYDPSEVIIVVPTQKYLIKAEARWVASHEHPGGKRDVHTPESSTFSAVFEAYDLGIARMEAKRRLATFESELPKKREGSLSWQSEDAKIVSTTFAQILEL